MSWLFLYGSDIYRGSPATGFCKFDGCSHFDGAPKKMITYLTQFAESNISGFCLICAICHLLQPYNYSILLIIVRVFSGEMEYSVFYAHNMRISAAICRRLHSACWAFLFWIIPNALDHTVSLGKRIWRTLPTSSLRSPLLLFFPSSGSLRIWEVPLAGRFEYESSRLRVLGDSSPGIPSQWMDSSGA